MLTGQVVIANVGDKDSSYREFIGVLPPSDCRYGGEQGPCNFFCVFSLSPWRPWLQIYLVLTASLTSMRGSHPSRGLAIGRWRTHEAVSGLC